MHTDSEIAIHAAGVSKHYGSVAALSDFDLGVHAGRTFGLVGANGAGKTTLIKCLLDFCALDAGHIEIFGLPSTRTAARSRLAFLPERFNPPYYLTGGDFLRLMLKMYRRPYDREAIDAVLAGLDLDGGALGKPVRTFSKGMTQKLGLAACLLSGRDLLVLDEPTSGLDPKARALLKRCLRQTHKLGGTVFLTSHALADVDEICDEMAVLHEGRVRFTGTPATLKQQYRATNLEEAYLECIA